MEVLEVADVAALPDGALGLFRHDDPFSSLAWYRATAAHAVPASACAAFLVVGQAGRVLAVVPMQRGPGRIVSALASPYASLWQPLLSAQARDDQACVRRIGRAIGHVFQAIPVLRLDALDAASNFLGPLAEGLRSAGFLALSFDHFGNWHQALPDSWAEYLAGRPAQLRATIRRRGRRLLTDLGARISVTGGGETLEQGIADYQSVYAASWKNAEPFPDFVAAFMREAARFGTLRLFLLHVKERPVAAQVWIVHDKCGHLLKLAHLETERALSPGTVLTAEAMVRLMESDGIRAVDFGRGDDEYKRLWVGERRQRVGVLFANPRTLAGAVAIARHAAGVLRRGKAGVFS